jgi:hypothetical protein
MRVATDELDAGSFRGNVVRPEVRSGLGRHSDSPVRRGKYTRPELSAKRDSDDERRPHEAIDPGGAILEARKASRNVVELPH